MKRNDLKQQAIYPFSFIYTKEVSYVLCYLMLVEDVQPCFQPGSDAFFQLIQEEL